jgi:enterochelin esterase-like enzyme
VEAVFFEGRCAAWLGSDRVAYRRGSPQVVSVVAAFLLTAVLSGCGSGSSAKSAEPPRATTEAGKNPVSRAPAVAMPTGPPAHFTVARHTSAGPVLMTRLKGAKSGWTGKVWVWLPPQYNDPRYAKTGFPVVILHTGGSGSGYNYWSNPKVLPAQEDDVRLNGAGKAHPFIMVMPALQPSSRQDTECSDIPGKPKMGTWLGEDVPDFVHANFRTLRSRDGWGTAGASSGAFCAVKLAAQHPDDFKAVVSWGGYFQPDTELHWSKEGRRANSPDLMLERNRPDLRLLLIAGGSPRSRDELDRMNALVKLIKPPTVATTYIQPNGEHFTKDLKKLVPMILEFLTANMQGPTSEQG